MSRGVAVVGVGQSKQAKKREVTIAALVREAVDGRWPTPS